MYEMRPNLPELIAQSKGMKSGTELRYEEPSHILIFSNTGKRGGDKKFFSLTAGSLLQCFKDISDNFAHFNEHSSWKEEVWRKKFTNLTNDTARAMGAVQTKPLFIVLAKLISLVNEIPYVEEQISLSAEYVGAVISYLETQEIKESKATSAVTGLIGGGKNIILYGAPGTGKSTRIEKELLAGVHDERIVRTVFHSETQASDFVGCLKPSMQNNGGEPQLVYAFQPGPFCKVLANALNNPHEMHYLVIEEINRAPAAAVFGEVFQLLDRNAEGGGVYEISATDPMQEEWLKQKVPGFYGKIKMPSNLTLLATMNSSDQAVMPMDTAFKRRWRFEYISIDFETKCPEGQLTLYISGSQKSILWKDFALRINEQLSGLEIPEDRHLGQWFVSDEELKAVSNSKSGGLEFSEVLIGKLFMYLWDDVLRHGQREAVFDPGIRTYGALVVAYTSGKNIFNSDLSVELADLASTVS